MQISKVATQVVRVTWDSLRLFNRTEGLSWGGAVGLYLFLPCRPGDPRDALDAAEPSSSATVASSQRLRTLDISLASDVE